MLEMDRFRVVYRPAGGLRPKVVSTELGTHPDDPVIGTKVTIFLTHPREAGDLRGDRAAGRMTTQYVTVIPKCCTKAREERI